MSDDLIGVVGMGGTDFASASAAAEAGATARSARAEVASLTAEVDRLFAITQALWQILREEHGYDDARLRGKIAAFDLAERTRRAEGAELPLCGSCARPASPRRPRCMYCGAETPMDPFAR